MTEASQTALDQYEKVLLPGLELVTLLIASPMSYPLCHTSVSEKHKLHLVVSREYGTGTKQTYRASILLASRIVELILALDTIQLSNVTSYEAVHHQQQCSISIIIMPPPLIGGAALSIAFVCRLSDVCLSRTSGLS